MANYVYNGLWDDCGIICTITSKSNLLIELCLIISSDEVIMGHINTCESYSVPPAITLYYSCVMNAGNEA